MFDILQINMDIITIFGRFFRPILKLVSRLILHITRQNEGLFYILSTAFSSIGGDCWLDVVVVGLYPARPLVRSDLGPEFLEPS